jgi:hypothetical protein
MPRGSNYEQPNARVMLIGDPKTYKTTWLLKQAEEGWRILLFNGDKGVAASILGQLSDKAKANVVIIDCADKSLQTNFVHCVSKFLKGERVIWDDTRNQLAMVVQEPTSEHIVIDPKKLGKYDIVCIDSYTKYVDSSSLRYALSNNIDLSAAQKDDWDGYGEQGRFLDWTLNRMTDFDCHFACIMHKKVQEKNVGTKQKPQMEVIGHFPVSSSNPHARTVGQKFSDIFNTQVNHDGVMYIDTINKPDRAGGSRNIAPGVYVGNDIKFSHCTGYGVPDNFSHDWSAIQFFGPGELKNGQPQTAKITPSQTTQLQIKQG